jgi:hypothetical protein
VWPSVEKRHVVSEVVGASLAQCSCACMDQQRFMNRAEKGSIASTMMRMCLLVVVEQEAAIASDLQVWLRAREASEDD